MADKPLLTSEQSCLSPHASSDTEIQEIELTSHSHGNGLRKRPSTDFKQQHQEMKVDQSRRIILVRHAEKLSYLPKRLDKKARQMNWKSVGGAYNGPLSTLGVQQAIETGERLNQLISTHITKYNLPPIILSSPFLRTVQTAHHIALQFPHDTEYLTPKIYLENGLFEDMKRFKTERTRGLPPVGSAVNLAQYFSMIEIKHESVVSLSEILPGEQSDAVAHRFRRTILHWLNQTPPQQLLIFVSHCTPVLYVTMSLLKDPIDTNRVKPYFAAITVLRSVSKPPLTLSAEECDKKALQNTSEFDEVRGSDWTVDIEASTDHLTRYASYCDCCKGCLHRVFLQRKRICRNLSCVVL